MMRENVLSGTNSLLRNSCGLISKSPLVNCLAVLKIAYFLAFKDPLAALPGMRCSS